MSAVLQKQLEIESVALSEPAEKKAPGKTGKAKAVKEDKVSVFGLERHSYCSQHPYILLLLCVIWEVCL